MKCPKHLSSIISFWGVFWVYIFFYRIISNNNLIWVTLYNLFASFWKGFTGRLKRLLRDTNGFTNLSLDTTTVHPSTYSFITEGSHLTHYCGSQIKGEDPSLSMQKCTSWI